MFINLIIIYEAYVNKQKAMPKVSHHYYYKYIIFNTSSKWKTLKEFRMSSDWSIFIL